MNAIRNILGISYFQLTFSFLFLFDSVILFLLRLKRGGGRTSSGCAIIKMDSIGDYILFRNFIKITSESDSYKGRTLTFVGNEVFRQLFEECDSGFVHNVIWVNKKKFIRNLAYRFSILNLLSSMGSETVIHPTYSRDFTTGDAMVRAFRSPIKIGFVADPNSLNFIQRLISDIFYTKLIETGADTYFEFERNRVFFSDILNKNLSGTKLLLPVNKSVASKFVQSDKYAVIFPGASEKFRQYSPNNFAPISKYLKSVGYDLVICGSKNEINLADKIVETSGTHHFVLSGRTTLSELVSVIGCADVLVTMDTSALHIGNAAGTRKVVGISNGHHYGRFNFPNSAFFQNVQSVYPKEIESCKGLLVNEIANRFGNGKLDINSISPSEVIRALSAC